jgi:hypothetical protein
VVSRFPGRGFGLVSARNPPNWYARSASSVVLRLGSVDAPISLTIGLMSTEAAEMDSFFRIL